MAEKAVGLKILEEIKNDYETAAEWLLYYPARFKQYHDDLNYICNEKRMSEVAVNSGYGNVVVQKVISLAELEKTERWLIVIELVHGMLGPKKSLFLQLRRKAGYINKKVNGREVWRSFVQTHYSEEMAKEYNTTLDKFWLHDNTITHWWNEIVSLVRLVALKKGCL